VRPLFSRREIEDPMTERRRQHAKAYSNPSFLSSREARALRILSEYLEPKSRFERLRVDDTIVFMGSARVMSRESAEEALRKAEGGDGDLEGRARRSEWRFTTKPRASSPTA
jgi:hypothetical protein